MNKFFFYLFLFICCQMAYANSYSNDILFNTLKEEVNYYFCNLKNDSIPVDFISFNAIDEKNLTIESDMGYSFLQENNFRRFYPIVKMNGCQDDVPDNPFVFSEEDWNDYQNHLVDLPLFDDIKAIKNVIWNTLSRKYRGVSVVSRLLSKRKKVISSPLRIKSKAEVHDEGRLPELNLDKKKWTNILNRITLNEKAKRMAVLCKAHLECQTQRKYLINSEGTAIVQNRRTFLIGLFASAKDINGVDCPVTTEFFVYEESDLPNEDTLFAAMNNLISRADALRKAPMAEAYSGPAILSGNASGVLFHEVLGHRLEHSDSEFKSMIGKKILPIDFNITCRPNVKSINGCPLSGYYLFDDEGVRAEKVECVKNGIMQTLLIDSTSSEKIITNNGHKRANFGKETTARQSNLFVETIHPYTEQQLRERLISELKRSNKEYGYYIHTVSNGWTVSGGSNQVASFNVVPVETYRIYADGRPDMLVRGVSLIGTPLTVFSNIKAAGNKCDVFNGKCGAQSGWIPVSCVSPMLYISQIETQCVQSGDTEKPFLSYPESTPNVLLNNTNDESKIFKAMDDEMKRSTDSLKQMDGSKPFFIDYVIRRKASTHIKSSLGTCFRFESERNKNSGLVSVVIGNKMSTTYKGDANREFYLPDEISYDHIRRNLWKHTDILFKNAMQSAEHNNRKRAKEFIDNNIPEWLEQPANTIIEKSALIGYQEDANILKTLSDTLSAEFKKYEDLLDSHVEITQEYTDLYRVTTDGLHSRSPQKRVVISVFASTAISDNKNMEKRDAIRAYDVEDLPSLDSLITFVNDFAKQVIRLRETKHIEDREYIGPVLYENSASLAALFDEITITESIYTYIHSWLKLSSREYDNSYKNIGKKVISKNISVWQLGNDSTYNGHRFFRYQKYDADGIRPATIELIRNGILINQLTGRIPSPKALISTGNEHIQGDWETSLCPTTTKFGCGVLRISFTKTMTREKLIKKLIKMAKEQGLDYAYILKGKGQLARIETKTGRLEDLGLICYDTPTKLELMGDIVASQETVANMELSVIHPQSILLPIADLKFTKDNYTSGCDRFYKLKH